MIAETLGIVIENDELDLGVNESDLEWDICDFCHGFGEIEAPDILLTRSECPDCGGSGVIWAEEFQ